MWIEDRWITHRFRGSLAFLRVCPELDLYGIRWSNNVAVPICGKHVLVF